jgi:adenine-specific DNA-methyltransferase
LFSAVDDHRNNLGQETCEKLFNCAGMEKNHRHFNEVWDEPDKWAEDMEVAPQKQGHRFIYHTVACRINFSGAHHMPTKEQLRTRLISKLKELFQLNQPDLDFGFYKIMHAKANQVSDFIEKDLVSIVEKEFSQIDDSKQADLKAAYEEAIATARKFGAPNPEDTDAVREARSKWEAAANTAKAEAEIYDHLHRFFERYYETGDFLSRRYYARETDDKAAPYAIPYNGEEVKLYWANADQYYIKTAEYFNTFTVDLTQAKEVQEQETGVFGKPTVPMPVHFKIVEATEGEHGNIKATDATTRYFIIHHPEPVKLSEENELLIQFEYRPDPEKTGQEGAWRDKRKAEAVETILKQLKELKDAGNYYSLLTIPAPTAKDKKRPLIAKYINQYTSRNTFDYFIHKDLGGFLRRELDFYVKNEVMRLDDIENADSPQVETYLRKIRIIRKVAHKLIDLLAQLEDFQKKLWLKKKFVVETNYCITLDRIPETLYPEIIANDAQRKEWVRLFAIDEIEAEEGVKGMGRPGYSELLSKEFLKANPFLVVDTRFFNEHFKAQLISSIDDFDKKCDGLLIHSENYQALSLLRGRYEKQVKCIYIDPPYNTEASPIAYKNSYRKSSWATLMKDRICLSHNLANNNGLLCATIDDFQHKELKEIIENSFGEENILGNLVIRNNPSGRPTPLGFAIAHEYAIFASKSKNVPIEKLPRTDSVNKRYKEKDDNGNYMWELLRKRGSDSERIDNPKAFYPFFVYKDGYLRLPEMVWNDSKKYWEIIEVPKKDEKIAYPIDENGVERRWRWGINRAREKITDLKAKINGNGQYTIYYKYRPPSGTTPTTNWIEAKYSATEHGTGVLKTFFSEYDPFSYPKSIYAVEDCLRVCGLKANALCLDYFAGSGTTGHAVINLNREDDGNRRYILVEMGDYFDTILKPRIQKVVYSDSWKDGKPTSRDSGISHCFKYIRLESYEDTLNNLQLDENKSRNKLLSRNQALREDYMLHYMLDVETRGSQSLLNIDSFTDPCAYQLRVKMPGSDQYAQRYVDLIETFNFLIGLRILHTDAPQTFNAKFTRQTDPELPENNKTRLVIDGKLKQAEKGPWWFRKVEGWVPADQSNPNNGQKEKVLIVWRKLTGDQEKDNLMLDEWFSKNRISPRDFEFDIVYVNGGNNLPNLRQEGENWKVRLIEEEFMHRMWDTREV